MYCRDNDRLIIIIIIIITILMHAACSASSYCLYRIIMQSELPSTRDTAAIGCKPTLSLQVVCAESPTWSVAMI